MGSIIRINCFLTSFLCLFSFSKAFCVEKNQNQKEKSLPDIVSKLVLEHQEEESAKKLKIEEQKKILLENKRLEAKKIKEEKKKKPKESLKQRITKKWQDRKDRKAYIAELKHQRKDYHQRNLLHSPQKYDYAVKIANVSAKMMEKHYAGKASIVAGASCLAQLKAHKNNEEELSKLYDTCNNQLKNFEKSIKNKEIKFVDHLDLKTQREVRQYLENFFPNSQNLISYLERSYRPTLSCSLKGGTLAGAWFLGGAISAHQLRCESQLGRRLVFGLASGTVGIGLGGSATFDYHRYKKVEDGTYKEVVYDILFKEFRNRKSSFVFKGSGAIGVGAMNSELYDPKAEELGVGLGVFGGLGPSTIFKIKDITPNFRNLFSLLEMDFLD